MFDIPCVLFAGGKSSRMGEDKALLPFSTSATLTEFQYKRLKKIFHNVFISCKDKNKFDFEASFIEDVTDQATFAPTAGFISAFQILQEDAFFAISVDTPFISKEIITQLILHDSKSNDATIACNKDAIQPLCGIYHRTLEKEFIKMLQTENHKLGFLLKNSDTKLLSFEDDRAFFNINNPQEYKQALTL